VGENTHSIALLLSGQDDIPTNFAFGECTNSLKLYVWGVDTISECLQDCMKMEDCEFFNFKITGKERNTCEGLANCYIYSQDSCFGCFVGKRISTGKTLYSYVQAEFHFHLKLYMNVRLNVPTTTK